MKGSQRVGTGTQIAVNFPLNSSGDPFRRCHRGDGSWLECGDAQLCAPTSIGY